MINHILFTAPNGGQLVQRYMDAELECAFSSHDIVSLRKGNVLAMRDQGTIVDLVSYFNANHKESGK